MASYDAMQIAAGALTRNLILCTHTLSEFQRIPGLKGENGFNERVRLDYFSERRYLVRS